MRIPNRLQQTPAMLRRRPGGIVAYPEKGGSGYRYGPLIHDLLGNRNEANSIVEFTLVFPILIALIMGIWQFGKIYAQMIALTQGTAQAAQFLQIDRTTKTGDPCADTYAIFVNNTPNLVAANATLTITINNGTPVTTNTCTGSAYQVVQGGPVSVKATYPYKVTIYGFPVTSGFMNTGTVTELAY